MADGDMNSEDKRVELSRACRRYLLASRMASLAVIKREVLTRWGHYTVLRDNLQAKEDIIDDGECQRRYILC